MAELMLNHNYHACYNGMIPPTEGSFNGMIVRRLSDSVPPTEGFDNGMIRPTEGSDNGMIPPAEDSSWQS